MVVAEDKFVSVRFYGSITYHQGAARAPVVRVAAAAAPAATKTLLLGPLLLGMLLLLPLGP